MCAAYKHAETYFFVSNGYGSGHSRFTILRPPWCNGKDANGCFSLQCHSGCPLTTRAESAALQLSPGMLPDAPIMDCSRSADRT
jgi:hypothetical protein